MQKKGFFPRRARIRSCDAYCAAKWRRTTEKWAHRPVSTLANSSVVEELFTLLGEDRDFILSVESFVCDSGTESCTSVLHPLPISVICSYQLPRPSARMVVARSCSVFFPRPDERRLRQRFSWRRHAGKHTSASHQARSRGHSNLVGPRNQHIEVRLSVGLYCIWPIATC